MQQGQKAIDLDLLMTKRKVDQLLEDIEEEEEEEEGESIAARVKSSPRRAKDLARKKRARASMTEEQLSDVRATNRARMKRARASMTEEQLSDVRAKDRARKKQARASMAEEQLSDLRARNRVAQAHFTASLTAEEQSALQEQNRLDQQRHRARELERQLEASRFAGQRCNLDRFNASTNNFAYRRARHVKPFSMGACNKICHHCRAL